MEKKIITSTGEVSEWKTSKPKTTVAPHIKHLPSEWVTKEEEEGDLVHELDPPHVVESILADKHDEILEASKPSAPDNAKEAIEMLKRVPIGERRKLRQKDVDYVKMYAIKSLIGSKEFMLRHGVDQDISEVYHLWFPENNVNHYELRTGNAPSRQERPKHMRDIDLSVDPMCPPKRIVDIFSSMGFEMGDWKKRLEEAFPSAT